MQNFISSETIIILSLLAKNTPNLLKYIEQYSANIKGRTLSPEKIQEACSHPNNILTQTLNTIAVIYNASKTADNKKKEILKQRQEIENNLVKTLSTNQNDQPTDGFTKKFQGQLIALNEGIKKLEDIKTELEEKFKELDNLLPTLDTQWLNHINKHYDKLITELQNKHSITLTEEEKNELRTSNSTSSTIKEQQEKPQNKLPKKEKNYFVINACNIVVNALDRQLKSNEARQAYDKIVKKLPAIKDEKTDSEKFIDSLKNNLQTIKDGVANIEKIAENITLPTFKQPELTSPSSQSTKPEEIQRLE